jgi:hypothetical protein
MFDPLPAAAKDHNRDGLYGIGGMIKLHHGRVTVQSPPEDKELTPYGLNVAFHVFLPEVKKKAHV